MRTIPKAYSKTPVFLWPTKRCKVDNCYFGFPILKGKGFGTRLFVKGRGCLSSAIEMFKMISPKRDEIIIPAYNARSLVFSAIPNNIKVRLIDIDNSVFFPSYEDYLELITDNTLAVILPYNWGIMPRLSEIEKIHNLCKEKKIHWIDDFATTVPQGDYLQYFEKNSPCQFYSFGKTKINTFMDGGYMYFSKNSQFYEQYKDFYSSKKYSYISDFDLIKSFFIKNFMYHIYTNKIGYLLLFYTGVTKIDLRPTNIHVDDRVFNNKWQGFLESALNNNYENNLHGRVDVFRRYNEKFNEIHNKEFRLFDSTKYCIGSRFPILFDNKKTRDKVYKTLSENNVGASLGHYPWLGSLSFLRKYFYKFSKNNYKNSIDFQDKLLVLPSHSRVTNSDIDFIVSVIKEEACV